MEDSKVLFNCCFSASMFSFRTGIIPVPDSFNNFSILL